MHKFKAVLVVIFLLLLASGFTFQRHAIACEAIAFSNFEQVSANVFSSPSVANVQQVVKNISNGKERVNSTFGKMIAKPKIVLVGSKDEAAKFGANSTATAHNTPFGTCIVLGPNGQNVDVSAHELTHAEVSHRVGWFTHWLEIPVWFDEGVALIVDHREPFLVENIDLDPVKVQSVKRLKSGREFFGGGNTHENYLASRLAVAMLEPSKLYAQLELVRIGDSFESVFTSTM